MQMNFNMDNDFEREVAIKVIGVGGCLLYTSRCV